MTGQGNDELAIPDTDSSLPGLLEAHTWGARLPLLMLPIAVTAAFFLLRHELSHMSYADVQRSIGEVSQKHILLALGATAVSYSLLTLYDVLGLIHVRKRLPYPKVALASFTSYVASHNLGLAGLGGGAVRFRMYSSFGLSVGEIAELIGFTSITFWLGLFAAGGVAFLFAPMDLTGELAWMHTTRAVGVVLIGLLLLYVALAIFIQHPLRIRRWSFRLPSAQMVTAQIPLAVLDWAASAMVFYALLPHIESIRFLHVFGIFMAAQILGMISHVPGGLGVFESIVLLLLPETAPKELVLGSLVVYRVVYYLVPLAFGLLLFVQFELRPGSHLRTQFGGLSRTASPIWRAFVPRYMAVATFLAGTMLLLSGSTPARGDRIAWMRDLLPLSVVEMGHFVASLVGAALVVLARGLQRRVQLAWGLTIALLGGGIVLSLLKGLDWEEAAILAVMLLLLLPCRESFPRHAALLAGRRTFGWILAWIAAVVGATLVGLFAFKHVAYTDELWWQFAFNEDAPRFLRASLGAAVIVALAGMALLLRPALPPPAAPTREDLELARRITADQPCTTANLAQLGDKNLIFDQSRRAFVMFAVRGRTWIAMGDPVGSPECFEELVWRLRDISEQHGGRVAFYQVGKELLSLYTEAGLSVVKVGECARVRLASFALEGRHFKGLRSSHTKLGREGATFDVLPPGQADLHELREVSDAWLAEKSAKEKGFSLGFWKDEYVSRCPVAVVRREGRIIAFANLWVTNLRDELSVDLMRHLPSAPKGTMDFLFVEMMLWGRSEGYEWFDLGMAPLAGVTSRKHSPAWNRVAGLVYRHGEHFYNFEGLRQYKDKFGPTWYPRYLAFEDGVALPFVLTNLTTLIGGGALGVIHR